MDLIQDIISNTLAFIPNLIAAFIVGLVGFILYLIPCGVLFLLFGLISKFISKTNVLNRKFKILVFNLKLKYWIAILLPLPIFGPLFGIFLGSAFGVLTS